MDIWKHGTYVDMWSLVHILTGAICGMGAYWIGFSLSEGVFYTLLLLVAWEGYEWILGILENTENVIMDVVVGMAGFGVAAGAHYGLGYPFSLELFAVVAVIGGAVALWGFGDFLRHGYR